MWIKEMFEELEKKKEEEKDHVLVIQRVEEDEITENLEVGAGILHPEGTKSISEGPKLIGVAYSGPTMLESTECSGPTLLEEKKGERLRPEGWSLSPAPSGRRRRCGGERKRVEKKV